MSTWKKIVLRSSDKEIFIVEEVLQAKIIKNMIKDSCIDSEIHVLNVDKKTLTKVIEYLTKHAHNKDSEDADLKAWDAEFINVDPNTLYDLMMAANYLCIRSLWELLLNSLTNMINGKSVEEIYKTFGIKI